MSATGAGRFGDYGFRLRGNDGREEGLYSGFSNAAAMSIFTSSETSGRTAVMP